MKEIEILKKLQERINTNFSEKGMCRLIYDIGIKGIYNDMIFEEQLPILYSLKPKDQYSYSPNYWFVPGDWESRIKIINEAVSIIEKGKFSL